MKKTTKRRAVFFDRDGVILKAVVENGTPQPPYSFAEYKEKSGIIAGAKKAVEDVRSLGFLAILVTNQPDIHYGKITRAEWERIQGEIKDIPFDDVFICFHGRDEECDCKKPKPGLLFAAARKWSIELSISYLVGDTESDVGAAKAAGCKSVLIRQPYNKKIFADIGINSLESLNSSLS